MLTFAVYIGADKDIPSLYFCGCVFGFRKPLKIKGNTLIVAEPESLELTHMGQCLRQRHVLLPDKNCQWLQHSLSLRTKTWLQHPCHEGDKRDEKERQQTSYSRALSSTQPPSQTPLSCCHHPLNFCNHPCIPSPLLSVSLSSSASHMVFIPLAHVVWCNSYRQYSSTPTRKWTSASSSLKPLLHLLRRKILGSDLGWRSCH